MKIRLYTLSVFLCLLLTGHAASAGNVLLIIADDLGYDAVDLYNTDATASLPPTPTIDSLAANGIRFENAYAYPYCSPSRAAMMTGRHGFRTGVETVGIDSGDLSSNEYTIAEALTDSGVIGDRMALIGKWHLGSDANTPNDIGGWPHYAGALNSGVEDYENWTKTVDGVSTANTTTYATTDNVNDAIDWISAQGGDNWFLWLAFNAPHGPHHLPPSDLHSYTSLTGDAADISANRRQYFEAMVEAMDTEMARLLTHIDLADTTVIFVGDNGTQGNVIEPPFDTTHGKGTIYEGGIRVPMIIAGEAVVNGGRTSSETVHIVDLYTTILELFGVNIRDYLPYPYPIDSRSLLPILSDETFAPEEPLVYTALVSSDGSGTDAKMASNGTFKLIRFADGKESLYRIATNISETNDFYADGILNATQQAAFDELSVRIDAAFNAPELMDIRYSAGTTQLDVAWFSGANLSLSKKTDLGDANWVEQATAVTSDTGGTTLQITLEDADDQAFYQVTHTE